MSMFHVRMCFLTLGRSAGRLNMRGHTHSSSSSARRSFVIRHSSHLSTAFAPTERK
jgi:hypothetical protein